MKRKLVILFIVICAMIGFVTGCTEMASENHFERERHAATYTSEYAKTVNKLEMREGNFDTYRRVTFYNVRLGETVFVCEGYSHVAIDKDGDVEIVVKTGPNEFLRHYLGQKQDITYFSEQLQPNSDVDNYRYKIVFNPKLWLPDITNGDW
ncbi:MAG: hypothetical protein MJZ37_00385 [Bacilli bacterium]|nr:hypothetical protein [Bacilli bacterium]